MKYTYFSSSTSNVYLNISIGAKCLFSMEILTLKSSNITSKDIQIMQHVKDYSQYHLANNISLQIKN